MFSPITSQGSGVIHWVPNCRAPSMGCMCGSMKPGISTLSLNCVLTVWLPVFSQGCRSCSEPTARMVPSRTATAVAWGRVGSMVMIFWATKTVMGALLLCAQAPEWLTAAAAAAATTTAAAAAMHMPRAKPLKALHFFFMTGPPLVEKPLFCFCKFLAGRLFACRTGPDQSAVAPGPALPLLSPAVGRWLLSMHPGRASLCCRIQNACFNSRAGKLLHGCGMDRFQHFLALWLRSRVCGGGAPACRQRPGAAARALQPLQCTCQPL